jgi:TonB family protein
MSVISAVSLWLMLGTLSIVDPLFPPHATMGGTVVAEVHFASGDISSVRILSGEEPFVDSCKSALSKWHADQEQDGDELVVIYFRQPYLYTLGSDSEKIKPEAPKGSLPYPIDVVSPSYPVDALGQGSVVLRTDISADGRVTDMQVIKSLGQLTNSSMAAVRKWKFTPAKNKLGKSIPAHAYVVFVYRYVLIQP